MPVMFSAGYMHKKKNWLDTKMLCTKKPIIKLGMMYIYDVYLKRSDLGFSHENLSFC